MNTYFVVIANMTDIAGRGNYLLGGNSSKRIDLNNFVLSDDKAGTKITLQGEGYVHLKRLWRRLMQFHISDLESEQSSPISEFYSDFDAILLHDYNIGLEQHTMISIKADRGGNFIFTESVYRMIDRRQVHSSTISLDANEINYFNLLIGAPKHGSNTKPTEAAGK